MEEVVELALEPKPAAKKRRAYADLGNLGSMKKLRAFCNAPVTA